MIVPILLYTALGCLVGGALLAVLGAGLSDVFNKAWDALVVLGLFVAIASFPLLITGLVKEDTHWHQSFQRNCENLGGHVLTGHRVSVCIDGNEIRVYD